MSFLIYNYIKKYIPYLFIIVIIIIFIFSIITIINKQKIQIEKQKNEIKKLKAYTLYISNNILIESNYTYMITNIYTNSYYIDNLTNRLTDETILKLYYINNNYSNSIYKLWSE